MNGCYDGYGTYSCANGQRYEGQHLSNMKHGHGIFWFGEDNNRFEGEFKEDKCSGGGKIYFDGSEESVTFEGVDIATVIEKYTTLSEDSQINIGGKVDPTPLSGDDEKIVKRSLVQSSKGLRYYCGIKIPLEEGNFFPGKSRWCKSDIDCTCDRMCGPTSGCQCQSCYEMTFPSEFSIQAPPALAKNDEVASMVSSENSSPMLKSKWGRVRMAVLTNTLNGVNALDSLPPPPSLLSIHSSNFARMPSIGRSLSTKVFTDSSPPLEDRYSEAEVGDSLDIDLPPPPPSLILTKSRSTHSTGGGIGTTSVTGSRSKWKKLKNSISIVGSMGHEPKEDTRTASSCDSIVEEPSPPPLLSRTSTERLSFSARRPSNMHFDAHTGYEGEKINGLYAGHGQLVYSGGATYTGFFEAGMRNGKGKFTYSLVSSYNGECLDGVPHGSGRMEYPNLSCYTGTFVKGLREGSGSFEFADGGSYIGEFEVGRFNGNGVLNLPNGNMYEGNFRCSRLNGKGVVSFGTSGLRFCGLFVDGRMEYGTVSTSKGVQRKIEKDGECIRLYEYDTSSSINS